MKRNLLRIFLLTGLLFTSNIYANTNDKYLQNKEINNYYNKVINILNLIYKSADNIKTPKNLNTIISVTNEVIDNIRVNSKHLTSKQKREILNIINKIVKKTKRKKQLLLRLMNRVK